MSQLPLKDDPDRQELYLTYLAGDVTETWPGKAGAAILAGTTARAVSALRSSDPDFARREDEALEEYRDLLRREADRRGRRGVLKAVWHKGTRCGRVREYDTRLLIRMLEAHCPEYTRKVTVDASVQQTGGLESLAELSPESQEDLRRILERERDRLKEARA